MQLIKRIIFGVFFTCLFISCKNSNSQNLDLSSPRNTIDYLSEKYITDLRMNIDGSTSADHPFYDYLDCKEEGFFVVHFIPKSDALQSYWQHDFLKEYRYEYDDAVLENQYIQKKIKDSYNKYNIFACHIIKNHIKDPESCTEEAVNFKEASSTDIYIYNNEQKTWKHLNSTPTKKNPLYYNSKYFKEHYPELFIEKDYTESSKSLDYYQNNESYFIAEIDVNKDQVPDKVVSSRAYKGNALIFFIKEKDSFQLRLRSVNLSQDGGNIIDSIYAPHANKGVLAIKTHFPDGGFLTATHYINYKNNDWTLTNTVYEMQESTEKNITPYTCDVLQNLLLKNLVKDEHAKKIKYLPSEETREKECTKKVSSIN